MTAPYAVRDLPLRKQRVNDSPQAYVAPTGVVLCDQSNKVCHLTQAEATMVITKLGRPSLRAYQHTAPKGCGYWHIGHVIS
jgi:hypothetical protein